MIPAVRTRIGPQHGAAAWRGLGGYAPRTRGRARAGRQQHGRSRGRGCAATEIPDPSKLYAAAKKLSIFLISRSAVLPVAAAPVTAFAPNGYGACDMIGNVWEWTTDWFTSRREGDAPKACCIPENPRGGREQESCDPCPPAIRISREVVKGGSHLCAPNCCRRYRPAARHAQPVDTSMSHGGFRCIVRKRGAPCARRTA